MASSFCCRMPLNLSYLPLCGGLQEGTELKTDRRAAPARKFSRPLRGRGGWGLTIATLLAAIGALASPLVAEASMTFTAQATNWRMLAVPQYHQQHGLSCEAAALRMTLAAFGINVAEDSLLAQIGADRRAPYWDASGAMH